METVLITGGTGSLGQALVNELLKTDIKSVRIFSRDEYLQWLMRQKLDDNRLRYLIGDVRDKDRLRRAMEGVDTVIHTAALKHIATAEYDPIETVKTNIDGTINVIDASLDSDVEKSIFISSDKAVYPINLYGATKLVGEKLFLNADVYGDTKFSCIRFGNFVRSRGSVTELWELQGNEITITDPAMTRYWISLERAGGFTLECIAKMKGGEVFIPKMKCISVGTMADTLAPDAERKIIGMRKGEKKHEVLDGD